MNEIPEKIIRDKNEDAMKARRKSQEQPNEKPLRQLFNFLIERRTFGVDLVNKEWNFHSSRVFWETFDVFCNRTKVKYSSHPMPTA